MYCWLLPGGLKAPAVAGLSGVLYLGVAGELYRGVPGTPAGVPVAPGPAIVRKSLLF